ncbi:MAG: metalloregulator ArsR/SmtB family transcription factor [Gemmatimonadota bacterium]|nr:metalloregulator ArsR/SmtB family transcription factor [Gemmatimonadota bacterium]
MVICTEIPGDPMPDRNLTPKQLRAIAERFKALAEPSRLEILSSLRQGERTVTEILEATGLGQANVSKHLQHLHSAGFVERRKEGITTCYRLADKDVLRLCELMCGRLEREVEVRKGVFGR